MLEGALLQREIWAELLSSKSRKGGWGRSCSEDLRPPAQPRPFSSAAHLETASSDPTPPPTRGGDLPF